MHLRLRDGGKIRQEIGDGMPAVEVIEQPLDGHARPGKTWRSAHDFRVNGDDAAFHEQKRAGKNSPLQEREMTRLAGPVQSFPAAPGHADVDGNGDGGSDTALLRSLMQGKTNAEIAADLGIEEDMVVRRLGELFARVGASSRAEATAFAFRERVL